MAVGDRLQAIVEGGAVWWSVYARVVIGVVVLVLVVCGALALVELSVPSAEYDAEVMSCGPDERGRNETQLDLGFAFVTVPGCYHGSVQVMARVGRLSGHAYVSSVEQRTYLQTFAARLNRCVQEHGKDCFSVYDWTKRDCDHGNAGACALVRETLAIAETRCAEGLSDDCEVVRRLSGP